MVNEKENYEEFKKRFKVETKEESEKRYEEWYDQRAKSFDEFPIMGHREHLSWRPPIRKEYPHWTTSNFVELSPSIALFFDEKTDEETRIYINMKQYSQCKYVLLSVDASKEYEEIENIDDALSVLNREHEGNKTIISRRDAFFGHCSNLQAWIEHDYDSRVLEKNLAFGMLKKLADSGDSRALQRLKEEICFRLSSKNENVKMFLMQNGYLEYLDKETFQELVNKGILDDFRSKFPEITKAFEKTSGETITMIEQDGTEIFVIYTMKRREYDLVLNEESAKNLARDYIANDLETDPSLFNQDFLMRHLDTEKLEEIMRNDFNDRLYEGFEEVTCFFREEDIIEALDLDMEEEDLQDEWDSTMLEKLHETKLYEEIRREYAKDCVENELETYFPKETLICYINKESFIEDAIQADGWIHFVGSYDGKYHECEGEDFVYWRKN